MLLQIFKSKIHRAGMTEANLNYVGSITVDEDLMDATKLVAGEKVQIVNNNNGQPIETDAHDEAASFEPTSVFPDEMNQVNS